MTIPSADEWSFANFLVEGRAYLEDDMPFEAIVKRVADLAVVVDGGVEPLNHAEDGAPKDITWRVYFTIRVDPEISDRYYNGRDGLRGRYWQGKEAGKAGTALSIKLLTPKLLVFAKNRAENFGSATLALGEPTLVKRSLRGQSAKTWAYEKRDQNFNEGPKLIVARWAINTTDRHWCWAPVGPLLAIKGAFYRPDNLEHVPLSKRKRACDIHRDGFS
jgi:hypothetical protein